MSEQPSSAPREVIDLTRETDVAYWCRIFGVSIDQLREAVKHAGHEPTAVQRHLSGKGLAQPPRR